MPKHVDDLYVINYTYLYHHIVVLDKYTHYSLVYHKHSADDETYDKKQNPREPCNPSERIPTSQYHPTPSHRRLLNFSHPAFYIWDRRTATPHSTLFIYLVNKYI